MIDWLVVEVRPVEIIVRIKLAVRAGIGEIQGFVRLHGHKNLHQREQPGEHTFMGVLLDLITCLTHRDAAFLEFHMDDRHAVDQQHEISPAVAGKGRLGPEDGLLRDLIPALPGGNLLPVIDLQADLPAKVEGIRRIVSLDGDGFAVDEAIEFEGRAQRFDLLQNLLHLAIGEGRVVQSVDAPVVLE